MRLFEDNIINTIHNDTLTQDIRKQYKALKHNVEFNGGHIVSFEELTGIDYETGALIDNLPITLNN